MKIPDARCFFARQLKEPYAIDLRHDPNRPWTRQSRSEGHVSDANIAESITTCDSLGFVVMRNYLTVAQINNAALASKITAQLRKHTSRRWEQVREAIPESSTFSKLDEEYALEKIHIESGWQMDLHEFTEGSLRSVLAGGSQALEVSTGGRRTTTELLAGDALLWSAEMPGHIHLRNQGRWPVANFIMSAEVATPGEIELS